MTQQDNKRATVVASVAGAVVGAGVAVAASKVMSDKKLRDKVTGTISGIKDQVVDILEETSNQGKQIAQKGGTAARELGANSKAVKK